MQSEAKRMQLGEGLKKAGAEAAVITLADCVCWLFNIRGHDVPHTPFTLAFAILHDDGGADLFLDPAKRNPELMAHLGNSVQVHNPDQFEAALDAMKGKTVLADPATAAAAIFDRLQQGGRQDQDRAAIPASCPRPARTRWRSKACARRISATARRWRGSSPGSKPTPPAAS